MLGEAMAARGPPLCPNLKSGPSPMEIFCVRLLRTVCILCCGSGLGRVSAQALLWLGDRMLVKRFKKDLKDSGTKTVQVFTCYAHSGSDATFGLDNGALPWWFSTLLRMDIATLEFKNPTRHRGTLPWWKGPTIATMVQLATGADSVSGQTQCGATGTATSVD